MLENLRIEWMKIRNYRMFQVFTGLYLAGILLIIYIFYRIYLSVMAQLERSVSGAETAEGSDMLGLFSGESIWNSVTFSTSFLLYLPGMVIISLFINEVNFKTHRQNIIDGWKRETFIYTKIGLILCMTVVITIMNFLATMVMFKVTGTDISFDGIAALGYSFLQSFTYLMLALVLATLFRKSGVAIIVFFIYGLIFELVLMWLFGKISAPLAYLLPLQASDTLVPFPREEMYQYKPAAIVLFLTVLAYIGLYIFLAIRKFKKDDL